MMTRKILTGALAAGALPVIFSLACGSNQTTASKSAAEYEESKRKGISVGGGEGHADHAQGTVEGGAMPAEGGPAHGEGTHGTPAHGATPVQKGETPAGEPRDDNARMDHTGAPRVPAGHAAHTPPAAGSLADHRDHAPSAGASSPSPTAAMDHSGMNHQGMAHVPGMQMAPPKLERGSAMATPGEPAATLRADVLDGPASTSVGDAARAAAMAAEMTAGGHAMAHGTYTHTDAGRDGAAPSLAPAPATDPHRMHTSRPGAKPRPKPSPTPDPHSMHGPPPSPQPSNSPNEQEEH